MHSDPLLWRPPGRMWEVCTVPPSDSGRDLPDVQCTVPDCGIGTELPCADPRDRAVAHLLAHARLAGAPHPAAFCRCRAQNCRLHPERLLCQGPVRLALLSSPDGWEAIEACSACVEANPDAEALAVPREAGQALYTDHGTPPETPRILTRGHGASARRLFSHLTVRFPRSTPDARLVALFLTLRTAGCGVAAFSANDITTLRLEDPRAALTEVRSYGWARFSVTELLSATPHRPAVVRVTAGEALGRDLAMEERERGRISGWAKKGKAYRGLRNQGSAVKLAALFLAAHADPTGRFRLGTAETALACATEESSLPAVREGLVTGNWAAYARIRGGRVEGRLGRYALHFVPAGT